MSYNKIESEYEVWETIVVAAGEVDGRLFDSEEEAVDYARSLFTADTVIYYSEEKEEEIEKVVATMTKDELSEALGDNDAVAYADVALRRVLY